MIENEVREAGRGQIMWDPAITRNVDVILGMMGSHWRVLPRQVT